MHTVLGRALWVGNKWTGKEIPLRRNVWGGGGEGDLRHPFISDLTGKTLVND